MHAYILSVTVFTPPQLLPPSVILSSCFSFPTMTLFRTQLAFKSMYQTISKLRNELRKYLRFQLESRLKSVFLYIWFFKRRMVFFFEQFDQTMRMGLTVGLPRKEDNMFLQDFSQTTALSTITSKESSSAKKGYQLRVETMIKERIKDIEENSEDYFNFGFNLQDFKQFLVKTVFSRATRILVDQSRLRAANRMMSELRVNPMEVPPPQPPPKGEE